VFGGRGKIVGEFTVLAAERAVAYFRDRTMDATAVAAGNFRHDVDSTSRLVQRRQCARNRASA